MNHPSQLFDSTKNLELGAGNSQAQKSTVSRAAEDETFLSWAVQRGLLDEAVARKAWENTQRNQPIAEWLVSQGLLSPQDRQELDLILKQQAAQKVTQAHPPANFDSTSPAGEASKASSQPLLQIVLGDFELLEMLGRGGMGIVYKAYQRNLKRVVALKMIRSGELADQEQVLRFYSEAEAAAGLDHPHIVPVYQSGEIEGHRFFSMAYVEGRSLSEELTAGPLPPSRAAKLMMQVAGALHYAHQHKIIHRDIKPGNILIDANDEPRIADFGLAKQLGGGNELTQEGSVLGTPSYMAPEQASGESYSVGEPADIYSAGATLYCLLTGRPPFSAASKLETIRQVVENDPVPPRRLNPAIPRDLETICLKCLRKEPSARYASAAALSDDLQCWLEHKPILARRAGLAEKCRLWCKRNPALAGSIAVTLLTAVLASALFIAQARGNAVRIAAAKIENDREKAASLVDSLLSAPAAGLPYAIETLDPLIEYAQPLLQERFRSDAISSRQRFNTAIALAHYGEVDDSYLVSSLRECSGDQCGNIVAALRASPAAFPAIHGKWEEQESAESPDLHYLARLSLAALYLGYADLAIEMVRPRENPNRRTVLIEVLQSWRPGLPGMPKLLKKLAAQPDLQYALVLGLANVSEQEAGDHLPIWVATLRDLYLSTNDTGVKSACDFALVKLGSEPPAVNRISESPVRFTNSIGMNFLRVPAGSFTRENGDAAQTVTFSRSFYLADRETTAQQFQQFSRQKAASEKTSDLLLPANQVSWTQAIEFCNWLSEKEGLTSCYQGEQQNRQWNLSADGYRLPTEAEWEYVCRANATTIYFTGDDAAGLKSYAVFLAAEPLPAGSKFPNRWGFFDMAGNVGEWCFDDWRKAYPPENSLLDPIGPTPSTAIQYGDSRVVRGGRFSSTEAPMKSAFRAYGIPANTSELIGFRVAKSE